MPSLKKLAAAMIGASLPLAVLGPGAMQTALIIGLCASLLCLAFTRPAKNELMPNRLAIFACAIFLIWLPSVFTSIEPLRSLETWGRIPVLMLATGLMLLPLKREAPLWRLALKSLIVGTTVASCWALFAMNAAWLNLPYPSEIYALGKHIKGYANVSICLIPAALWAGISIKWSWRNYAYLAATLSFLVIVQSKTGAAVAGLLAGTLTVGFVAVWRNKKYLLAYVAYLGAMAAGAFFWLSEKVNPDLPSPNIVPNWLIDGHRQYIWQFAYQKFLESPWFGYGMNAIDRIPGAKENIPGIGHPYIPSHPHNAYLEIAAETGVFGLLALLLLIVGFAYTLARQYWSSGGSPFEDQVKPLAFLFVWSAFWGAAALNVSIWSVWWQLTLFVSMALLISAPPGPGQSIRHGQNEHPLERQ